MNDYRDYMDEDTEAYADRRSQEDDSLNAEIYETLRGIILDQMDVDEEDITPDAEFVRDLHADSLDITLLMRAISEEFEIPADDTAVDRISTVREAVAYIEDNL